MLKTFLLVWLAVAVAIGLTAWLLPGVEINGGFGSLLVISAVFGFVNAIIGTIVKLLTLPLTVMTLGLFALVVNALMLLITDWWVDRLDVDGFLTALLATVLISLFSTILQIFLIGRGDDDKEPDRVRRIANTVRHLRCRAPPHDLHGCGLVDQNGAQQRPLLARPSESSLDDERVTAGADHLHHRPDHHGDRLGTDRPRPHPRRPRPPRRHRSPRRPRTSSAPALPESSDRTSSSRGSPNWSRGHTTPRFTSPRANRAR